MERKEFIKYSGLASLGILTGMYNPILAFSPPKAETRFIKIDASDENGLIWLGRLIVSSLVTSMAAKVVDNLTSDCTCNGASCAKNTPQDDAYYNHKGIYGYDYLNTRFVHQNLRDSNVTFENCSVPFLSMNNAKISVIEGPFLAALCWAIDDARVGCSPEVVSRSIFPTAEISNGGYRFDINPCYPTEFKTKSGSTKIEYKGDGQSGEMTVIAKDSTGKQYWDRQYAYQKS
jgi:hypothetical protein